MSTDTHQMSAASALKFDHFSVHNAVQAQLACSTAVGALTALLSTRL